MGETGHIFPATDVMKIAEVTYPQLGYARQAGLVLPSIRPAGGKGSGALYSFVDVVQIAVLIDLGQFAGMTAQHTRKVLEYLRRPDALDVERFPFLVVHEYDQAPLPMVADEVRALFTAEDAHPVRVVINLRAVMTRLRARLAELLAEQAEQAARGNYGSFAEEG
jgi:DNA-binding transcriptional MerR regulator